ncbi:stress-induced protein [Pseudomonas fulva]|uniref:general stress protein n=1 Tax=Pseudomonas fulva TaxID=47880 RepID=UPI0018AB0F78|nr:KGG domain-containing protein [Pseudomonas fulva]MBF8674134.1 stress-induced protein [Pseudomonas fulva]MBF8695793.1 stress-induced protein [Pseudomonas fulva]
MATKDNSRSGNQQGSHGGGKNSGNFANDREKASEAGKKGGQASGGHSSESGRKGGKS